jgi:hypothetical protein
MKKLILLITLCLFSNVSWAECVEGDCVNGKGTYTYEGGLKYVGEWKNHQRDGLGDPNPYDGRKIAGL